MHLTQCIIDWPAGFPLTQCVPLFRESRSVRANRIVAKGIVEQDMMTMGEATNSQLFHKPPKVVAANVVRSLKTRCGDIWSPVRKKDALALQDLFGFAS